MAADGFINEAAFDNGRQSPPPEFVAGGAQWHPLTTAAVVGGAIAATAGAYLGARAIARRNGASEGKPVNSVMATAITAGDVKPY
jgi:hypothetical protein